MTRKFNKVALKPRRRQLRRKSTEAEIVLWKVVRNRKLGYKFIRQYSIDGYVIDFYCAELKLGIELEGGIHQMQSTKVYDAYHERYIKEFGVKLLKFSNEEIIYELQKSIKAISLSLPKRGIKG